MSHLAKPLRNVDMLFDANIQSFYEICVILESKIYKKKWYLLKISLINVEDSGSVRMFCVAYFCHFP